MGMYDKLANFGEVFKPGDRFVITGAEYVGNISTRFGDASKSIFTLVTREHPDVKKQYSVLGEGFARQAQNASAADFPHVAEYTTIPSREGQSNLKLLAPVAMDPRDWINGDDGPPPIPVADPLATPSATATDDLGF